MIRASPLSSLDLALKKKKKIEKTYKKCQLPSSLLYFKFNFDQQGSPNTKCQKVKVI
jgi:hypothetical protein